MMEDAMHFTDEAKAAKEVAVRLHIDPTCFKVRAFPLKNSEGEVCVTVYVVVAYTADHDGPRAAALVDLEGYPSTVETTDPDKANNLVADQPDTVRLSMSTVAALIK